MKDSDPHIQKIIQKVKNTLDNESVDLDIQVRLRDNRHRVLELSENSLYSRFATPVLAFAGICAVVIAITLTLSPSNLSVEISTIEAFEIISTTDSLEMYENLDFYLWLEEEFKVKAG